jgi:hypothetical protein
MARRRTPGTKEKQMRYLKMLSLATLSTAVLMAFAAGSASATTLEVGGVAKNSSVTFEASLKSGTSMVLRQTDSSFWDTCTTSTFKGATEGSFTGVSVGGKISSMTFLNCTHQTKVDTGGTLSFEHVGTTNGTVRSTGWSVTIQSTTFGATLNCTTNNTHLGVLTGSAAGHASLKMNAVINCGFFVPSSRWEAEYTFTSPTGLGVVA